MKLELKNVKFFESMSEETNAFTADLFINGKKNAFVKNDGRGGCTDYNVYDFKEQKILREAEAYCLSLPKEKIEGLTHEFQPTLESKIDELFEAWLDVKENKKLEANMKKGILVGTKNHYSIIVWKGITLEAILNSKNPTNLAVVKKTIANYKSQGKNILNTNIPEELLE